MMVLCLGQFIIRIGINSILFGKYLDPKRGYKIIKLQV